MILNTGNRSDIPAFFSDWFFNRIQEGFVCVRNPYFPHQVTKYILDPQVIDIICFCTKNPKPMLSRLDLIKDYKQFWFVTITPYNQTIEPYVPNKNEIIRSFIELSKKIGSHCIGWRYDPIFLNDYYTIEYHLRIFEKMCQKLTEYTHQCVISFIDLYQKTKKNFKEVQEVSQKNQIYLCQKFVEIGKKYNIEIYTCHENESLKTTGVHTSGCMNQQIIERALGHSLKLPKINEARQGCRCLLNNDIGIYNTCLHGCLYCYANYDRVTVLKNVKMHNKKSPFLIGDFQKDDIIKEAKQVSYIDRQLSLF
nr:DUF1848 domain-containing protein [uncultured Faecalibacillus sp.]